MAVQKKATAGVRMVMVHLPRPQGGEATEQFVSVNGKNFLVKKGVDVQVPYYVAEVLDASERASEAADRYIDGLEG